MPTATMLDDDQDEIITADGDDAPGDTPDNGNTPDTAEQIAAAEAERKRALKHVAAEGEEDGAPPRMIPKGRFDEVNNEKKALQDQLSQALAALASAGKAAPAPEAEKTAPAFDLKAAMRERLAAIVRGDDDRALELDEEIQAETLKRARAEARQEFEAGQAEREQRTQAESVQKVAATIKKQYPQLDDKSEEADEDAILFVIARRDALIQKGEAPSEALRKASAIAADRFGFGAADGANAPTKTDGAAARLIATRERNARAAAQQPPELGGKGDRATQTQRANVAEMTDEEFAALPAAEKKRLRGDA